MVLLNMVLLKKFLMALAITLSWVTPVSAGDSDRARDHWQGQGAKIHNFKAPQHSAWGHSKKAHLEDMRVSAGNLWHTKKRLRTAFPSGTGREGLISRYKHEYQIAVGRSLTRHQRLLVGVPSHRFRRGQSKGSRMRWDKGSGKSWGKGCDQGWGQRYGKKSNKRHGMGGDEGAGKRGDRSRGDKSQKNRKKKSFDSD